MPSRRPHVKSRLGCAQCKARRVKCDETYPRCKNCQRFAKTCSYGWASSSDAHLPNSTDQQEPISNHSIDHSHQLTFDALDMKLMHYYSTSTAESLSLLPEVRHVWQYSIPDQAYEQPLLMHGLLALAGTHLAHSNCGVKDLATDRFYVRALHHQQMGLQMFRHQLQRLQDTSVSHETLVLFSAVLCILTFAQLQTDSNDFTLQDIIDIFSALRGKRALWTSGNATHTKETAKLLYKPRDGDNTSFEHSLAALCDLQGVTDNSHVIDGIIRLVASLKQASTEFRMVGSWPTSVSDDFISLIKARDTMALRVLHHYSVILNSLRGLWWVGNCGERFRKAIEVGLDEESFPDSASI